MKTVCIVGAGPAGLVTAKTLLQQGVFKVTIYEKGHDVGGIWAVDHESRHSSPHNFLGAHTPTNLSKFTVAFSDLSWDSVDLAVGDGDQVPKTNGEVPMFPKAWMVRRYLKAYQQRYLSDDVVEFERNVCSASRVVDGAGRATWQVTTTGRVGLERTETFDFLVAASGFFSQPRTLQDTLLLGDQSSSVVTTIHSSQYRHLSDLQPKEKPTQLTNIVVVGGGNSSGEAAATVASQLSSAQWSPRKSDPKQHPGCRIYHVTPRQIYALPPYNITDDTSTTFVPLDLKLYDLSKRPTGPVVGNAGRIPATVKDMIHHAIQDMIGSDQSDLGSDVLVSPAGSERTTPYVALSESYSEYVRAGLIVPVSGRPSDIVTSNGDSATMVVESGGKIIQLDNIGAIIECTGYSPATALSYLPRDVKEALHFDAESSRLPLILENWQTMNNSVSDIAFIGFYEGPYWGVMEQQARLTAARWINDDSPPAQRPYETQESLLSLRKAMQERGFDVPQYWFGDYIGYMEEIATALKLQRNDGDFEERTGCVAAARYLAPGDDKCEADKTMHDLHATWRACQHGRYGARAVMRALQGKWELRRDIASVNASYPSGSLKGEAAFHPRAPTAKGFDLEYLYIESGEFRPSGSNLPPMTASRRYVYRYSEQTDQLSVWFVKPEQNLEVDYLFHDLSFVSPAEAREAGCLVANADHLCVKDMYTTEYRMVMKGIALRELKIQHAVKGPPGGKDYRMTSSYTRPSPPGAGLGKA